MGEVDTLAWIFGTWISDLDLLCAALPDLQAPRFAAFWQAPRRLRLRSSELFASELREQGLDQIYFGNKDTLNLEVYGMRLHDHTRICRHVLTGPKLFWERLAWC